MFQQPDVIRRALEGRVSKDRVLDAAFGEESIKLLAKVEAVTIVACVQAIWPGVLRDIGLKSLWRAHAK